MISVAIIGLGSRGSIYAHYFHAFGAKITAVCDKNPSMLNHIRKRYSIPEDKAFLDEKDFFAAGKCADALVIATQDRDHYRHAMAGMDLGYHLLCEKPVAPYLEQCVELEKRARELGLKMVICHVLRYAAYYDKIKEIIDSGLIGEVTSINQTENVGYWHFSHSFVRGNWHNEDETGPSILSKCCHDLDLIYYFCGKPCEKVYSTGTRRVFIPSNAPEGSADRCCDCKFADECLYDVAKLYYKPTRYTVIPKLRGFWLPATGVGMPTLNDIKEALRTGPYGKCAYKCDNNVMENQIVNCKMGDINATLTMTAQSDRCYRRIHISGTKGEIYGADNEFRFTVNIFGGKSKTVRVKPGIGHLGGDKGIVRDFIKLMETGTPTSRLSLMSETIMSHKMAFAAEKSRLTGEAVTIE